MWLATTLGLIGLSIPSARPWLSGWILVVAPLALALVSLDISRLALYTVLGLVAAGGVLALLVGATWSETASALTTMCGIFAFVAVVRLLEIPLLRRHLDSVLAARLARMKTEGSLLWPGALLTYGLSLVLSFGAVPMAYRSVNRMFGSSQPMASGSVVSRSFLAANSLTPLSPPLALALSVVGLTWMDYLGLGLIVLLVGTALIFIGPKPTGRIQHIEDVPGQGSVREFVMVLSSIVGLIVLFQLVLPSSGIVGSTVLSVLIVLPIWEILTGGARTLGRRVLVLAVSERKSWRDQYVLLVASGLVVAAAVHWGERTDLLRQLQDSGFSLLIVLAVVPIAITLLALVGVYPMTSLLLVCTVLPPLGGGVWDVLVVGVAVLGVHVGFLMSPISGLTLLMAAMTRSSPVAVGLRWNSAFGVSFLVAGTAAIIMVAWLAGI